MFTRISISLSATLVVALIAAGCGGGDDNSSSLATSSLTKAQYIKQADEICKKIDEKQLVALDRAIKKDPSINEASKVAQGELIALIGIPLVQQEAKELTQLGAPAGDEDEIAAIIAGIDEAIADAEKEPVALIETTVKPFEAVDKLATQYGFKLCSEVF